MNHTVSSIQNKQLYDAAEVEKTLSTFLSDGQVTEIRILNAVTVSDRWEKTYFGYFDDPQTVLSELPQFNAWTGCYFIPNPVNKELLSRAVNRFKVAKKGDSTSDRNIDRRKFLLIDADVIRAAGISATEQQRSWALERIKQVYLFLKSQQWPDPIAADSSNGGHLCYLTDCPVADEGLFKRCLQALCDRFTDELVKIDETAANPSRIWKLYGTRSCKGDETEDRQHRLARLLNVPQQLQPVPAQLLLQLGGQSAAPAVSVPQHGQDVSIERFIELAGLDVEGPFDWLPEDGQAAWRWTLNQSPCCDHHGDGPFIVQFSNGARSAGCHHDSCSWGWQELKGKYPLAAIGVKGNGQPAVSRQPAATVGSVCIDIISLTEVEAVSIDWFWPNRIAYGKFALCSGDPGLGKTFLFCDLAARLSTGRDFPDGAKCEPAETLLLTSEDGLADTIKPRLIAQEADHSKIFAISQIRNLATNKAEHFDLTRHLPELDALLEQKPAVRLLILDPVSAFMGRDTDDHKNADVRGVLGPVCDVLERRRVALLGIHHDNKNDTKKAVHRVLGSVAYVAAARVVWVVKKDPDDKFRRLFLPVKNNLGFATGLAFRILKVGTHGQLVWEEGPVETEPDDLGETDSPRDEAARWLQFALAEGRVESKDLQRRARDDGQSWSTIRRAQKVLEIKPYQADGKWWWELPQIPQVSPEEPFTF